MSGKRASGLRNTMCEGSTGCCAGQQKAASAAEAQRLRRTWYTWHKGRDWPYLDCSSPKPREPPPRFQESGGRRSHDQIYVLKTARQLHWTDQIRGSEGSGKTAGSWWETQPRLGWGCWVNSNAEVWKTIVNLNSFSDTFFSLEVNSFANFLWHILFNFHELFYTNDSCLCHIAVFLFSNWLSYFFPLACSSVFL